MIKPLLNKISYISRLPEHEKIQVEEELKVAGVESLINGLVDIAHSIITYGREDTKKRYPQYLKNSDKYRKLLKKIIFKANYAISKGKNRIH